MRRIATLCLVLLCIHPGVSSQDKGLFKKTFLEAEYFFMTEEYREALHLYLELLKTDPENANLQFLIGACYLSIDGEKKKAIPYLERAVENMSPSYREGSYKERSAPREALFALARACHINGDYDQAIKFYETYRGIMIKSHFADLEYVNNQIKSCERAKGMVRHARDVEFTRLSDDVNRFTIHYNPVVSYDDSMLIYMTDRPLYRAIVMSQRLPGGGWTEPRVINEEIGSDGDCWPVSMSANGKELYLVRKDAYGSDIFVSYRKGDRFTGMIPLNRNINSNYSETHACISYNGKLLYFTSDRPGGQGALDIWVSETTVEGDWGPPRNLGPKINTHYSEETPFLAERGTKLYFSSQGHATMGGFDIFVSERLPYNDAVAAQERDSRRKHAKPAYDEGWSFPENLGYPLSTPDDDLFYNPRKSGHGAYMATIVDGINPLKSLYLVRIKEEEPQIAAVRKGSGRKEEKTGEEAMEGPGTDSLLAEAVKETETRTGTEVTAGTGEKTVTAGEKFPDQPEPDEYYVLNSIMFGFDSDELDPTAKKEADRVFDVMQRNPEIRLRLTGHADAVGAEEYNLRLSERRAQSIADYLMGKGIPPSRIEVTGAGEIMPIALNTYEDGTDSPEGRRLNRHVSIKLENLQDPSVRIEDIFVPQHLKPMADRSYSILLVNSKVMLDTMPDEVAGEQTALIITDSAFLYTAGNFRQKARAMQYLNEVLDAGYPDAGMLEQDELEDLIASLSEEGIAVTASFTIQIMALKNPVETDYFKPLEGVLMFAGQDGFHRYVYGDFKGIQEAQEKLPSIRAMGYQDAFIISILRFRK